MQEVMPMIVIPIVIVTLLLILHYHYKNRILNKSLPIIFMLINTSLVWIFQFASWLKFTNLDGSTATFDQLLLGDLLTFSNLFDAVSIFLYTWPYLDVFKDELSEKYKKIIIVYKTVQIIAFPLITYSMYFSMSYRYANSSYLIL